MKTIKIVLYVWVLLVCLMITGTVAKNTHAKGTSQTGLEVDSK